MGVKKDQRGPLLNKKGKKKWKVENYRSNAEMERKKKKKTGVIRYQKATFK